MASVSVTDVSISNNATSAGVVSYALELDPQQLDGKSPAKSMRNRSRVLCSNINSL